MTPTPFFRKLSLTYTEKNFQHLRPFHTVKPSEVR